MQEGIKLIQITGNYGYSVTRVGKLKRISGDEWQLLNAVTLVRAQGRRGLDDLAFNGPQKDHIVSQPSKVTEELHRLCIRRALTVNEEVWKPILEGK